MDLGERGAEGAEGVGSEEGISPLQLGWGFGRGCVPPQKMFVKFRLDSPGTSKSMRFSNLALHVSKVKLYIAPVKPAPEGDGVFSGACWR